MAWAFDNSYYRDLTGFYVEQVAETPPEPRLVRFNGALAARLGLDVEGLDDSRLAGWLSGAEVPEGAQPLAQVYAGHQFGGFSPQLGDGRAVLLGEIVAPDGGRFDLQLKGSGRTPFSRGGDGKAALGPVLREYLISEAMHALGIPTTRSLAATMTGELVTRDRPLPGAVLARVAASHIRVGTFQFVATQGTPAHVRQLASYAIMRHYPDVAEADNPPLALLDAVLNAQASLVAQWMLVGFVHGVMNTDNVTISGETIDYGPCAFLDRYSPYAVFSSIDHNGRYAFGQQPAICRWNLTRFAETLIGLIDSDADRAVTLATEVLDRFPARYEAAWLSGMRAKLGLARAEDGDLQLAQSLFSVMEGQSVDFTLLFRALADEADGRKGAVAAEFTDPEVPKSWVESWRERLDREGGDPALRALAMRRVNPAYIPRNHKVEEALAAAVEGQEFGPFETLLDVISHPFDLRDDRTDYAQPAPGDFGAYVTFCGT